MGLLGTMTVRFGADLSDLTKGVQNAKGLLGSFPKNPVSAVVDGMKLAGEAVIGLGLSSAQMAGDFEQSILKVRAYAGLTKADADSMSASLLNMAQAVGQSPKALADALYPIISAGYSSAEALSILRVSAMTATASGADTAKVADGLTTALKAMGEPATKAGLYMDIINKTTSQGKMEIPGYAAIIGKLSLAASGAKVPFVDMNAALATLTTHGFPSVAQASNSLGNLFTQIGVKTDALEQHAKKLKLSFDAHAFSTMSLGDKIAYLNKITGGNQSELLKLVGGSTLALKAFNSLTTGSQAYTDNLKALQGASGATQTAFDTASSGFNASMQRVHAAIDVVQIKIGQALLPALTGIANTVAPLIAQFADWVEKNHVVEKVIDAVKFAINFLKTAIQDIGVVIGTTIGILQNIAGWFQQNERIIMSVVTAIAVFFAPALIKAGLDALTSGAQMAAGFISKIIQTGVESVIAGGKMAVSFIGNIIQAGIEGWQAVGGMLAFVGKIIASGAESVIAGGKMAVSFIAKIIQAGAEAVVAGGKFLMEFIPPIIESGVQATIAAGSFIADLIPSIITMGEEAISTAVTAIPAIIAAMGSWVVEAGAVAVANIAAFWPIYLAIGAIITIVGLVVLAITHWTDIVNSLKPVLGAVGDFFVGVWHDILNVWNGAIGFFQGIAKGIGDALGGLGSIVTGVWDGIKNGFKAAINWVIGGINNFINFLDGLHIDIPHVDVGPVHIGGGSIRLPHIPDIPTLANGGRGLPEGWKIVGERGPEMTYTGRGSSVFSNSDTNRMLGDGGNQTIIVELDSQVLANAVGKRQAKMTRVRMGRRNAA